jgi:putative iron-regulated protein
MTRRPIAATMAAAILALAATACSIGPGAPSRADVAETYADLVHAAYDASIASATELQASIEAFLADPTDATLASAKEAWIAARDDYGPTEAFRFYDGPIDNPEDGPEGQINAWPMDEAYVDYVEESPDSGIIADATAFPEITADAVIAANEAGGETNISTGWHAIEFLLWGQDLDPAGPGARPLADYTDDPNAGRRADYLRVVTDQLIADLTSVREQWAADGGAYREEFVADADAAVTSILRGIGALSAGELAGERMAVAFETRDQEDEHSCFSDNTNADVLGNARGVRMVYLAEFDGVDGASLSELVAAEDPDLDEELKRQLDASIALVEDFPATFEAMIAAPDGDPARQAFEDALVAIETQGETIARVASALGLTISVEV